MKPIRKVKNLSLPSQPLPIFSGIKFLQDTPAIFRVS